MSTANQHGPSGDSPGSQRNPLRVRHEDTPLRVAHAHTTTGHHYFAEVAYNEWVPVDHVASRAELYELVALIVKAGGLDPAVKVKSTAELIEAVPGLLFAVPA